jgi:CRP/FNR family cyclic AMP-dependent transcriptional regulator
VTDVALVPISELQFLLLVTRKPAFALEVMRVLAHRLRAANKAM